MQDRCRCGKAYETKSRREIAGSGSGKNTKRKDPQDIQKVVMPGSLKGKTEEKGGGF